MILHLITATAALATNPLALVVVLIDNPMFVLLLLSVSWLLPEVSSTSDE